MSAGRPTVRGLRAGIAGLVLAIVAAVSVAAPGGAQASERPAAPRVGEVVPDVSLADQNGRRFVLSEVLKERAFVVLAFYPKAFTSG